MGCACPCQVLGWGTAPNAGEGKENGGKKMQGYYNKEQTLTVCPDCRALFEGETWTKFPNNFEADNCTECYSEIGG